MRFIKVFIVTVCVILVAAVAITFIVDPLFQYHTPWFGMSAVITDERYQNAGVARNMDFDNALIGNSLAENFYVSDLETALGSKTAKLTSSGSHPLDWTYVLEILSKRDTAPKRIMFNLDPYIFRASVTELKHELPVYLYDNCYLNDVDYLLNFEIFKKYTFDTVIKNIKNSVPDYNTFSVWDESVEYGREHILATTERAGISSEKKDVDAAVKSAIENMALLAAYFESMPDTEFIFFCSPFSVLYWDNSIRGNAFEADENCYYAVLDYILKYDNVTVYFWSDDEMLDVISDLDYYLDEAHYDSRVCSIMADRIKDKTGIVTKDNYADSVERLFSYLRSYDYDSIWN